MLQPVDEISRLNDHDSYHRSLASEEPQNCIFLEETIGAIRIEFSFKELKNSDEATSLIKVQGERYPESAQKMIDR